GNYPPRHCAPAHPEIVRVHIPALRLRTFGTSAPFGGRTRRILELWTGRYGGGEYRLRGRCSVRREVPHAVPTDSTAAAIAPTTRQHSSWRHPAAPGYGW